MERRKFLIGMGSLAAGGAAAMGTGAFSTVRADRDMTINTVNDEYAFLKLIDNPDYSDMITDTGSNQLALTFDKLNLDAYTEFADLFRIANQGTKPARVWLDTSNVPDDVSMGAFGVEDGAFNGGPGPAMANDGGPSSLGNGTGVILAPGAVVKVSPYFGEFGSSDSPNVISEQTVNLKIWAVTKDSELAPDDFSWNGYNTNLESDVNPNWIGTNNSQDTPSY
ncbi:MULTISPECIES: hypothetical protein [Salinibaculum]|uniref:hypothetical protein n=1 Tax=Salinibaculum TaxID=2732368 RepID=UPI0030CB9788